MSELGQKAEMDWVVVEELGEQEQLVMLLLGQVRLEIWDRDK